MSKKSMKRKKKRNFKTEVFYFSCSLLWVGVGVLHCIIHGYIVFIKHSQ